jgi:hypothetical protein
VTWSCSRSGKIARHGEAWRPPANKPLLPWAGESLGEVLNFLLQLGFREVGAPFAAAALRASERGIATDLAQLGLLLPFRHAAPVPP